MKRYFLGSLFLVCLALPQGVLAKSDLTVLFTGDLFGQATAIPK